MRLTDFEDLSESRKYGNPSGGKSRQARASDQKPSIVPPNKGHQSKHPFKGKLVGDSVEHKNQKVLNDGDVIPFQRPTKGYFFKLFGYLEDTAGNQGWVIIGQYQDFEEVKNRAKKLIDGYGIPASAIKPENLAIFRYEKGTGDKGESIDVKSLGIPKHGPEFAEAKGDIRKALGGAALAGLLGYGAMKANNDMDQQAFSRSVQLPQLELYLDYAEQQGDNRMIRQLKQRIGDHKMRLSLGKGDVRDGNSEPIEVVYDKEGIAQGPKTNEAEEPKTDKSARHKLDHSLRAQGHKVEKDKKKELRKGAVKHKGKLYDHLIALEGDTDIPFNKCPKCEGPIYQEDLWDEHEHDEKILQHAHKFAIKGKDLEIYAGKTVTLWTEGSSNAPIQRSYYIKPGKMGRGIFIDNTYYGPEDFVDHNAAADYSWKSKWAADWYSDNVQYEMDESKKDACYHKVKSRYKVWPSAYASGALVKCRKVGAKNWGNKSKKK